jgi:phospholipid-binding lipoprotein MlaA
MNQYHQHHQHNYLIRLMYRHSNLIRYILIALLAILSIGCASVTTPNPKDPFESYNRTMFKVNTAVDAAITEPIARGYTAVIPSPIRDCVGNMFDNLKVPFSALNNVLQGKLQAACEDVARFAINTTAGVAGCFDIATKVGLPNHKEDLGQTLATWGVPAGPYVMLPLLGPSNVRDGLARIGQMAMNAPVDRNLISTDIDHIPTRNTLLGMNLIQTRAELLPATDALKKMGVDEYAFVRDSSINRRQNQVYDGNPPDEPNSDDVTDNSSDSNSANEPTASTVSQ